MWLDADIRDRLRDHAADVDTSMGAIVRNVLEDIVEEPLDPLTLRQPATIGSLSVSVEVDDDLWYAARSAAMESRHSLASMVRKRLSLLL
jgi:hypothetical protein